MAHNIAHFDYPENCNRKNVQHECDTLAKMEDWQEGCSGVNPIRWLDNVSVQDDYDEAKKYIETHDKGWYDCLAVKYYDTSKLKPSANAKKLAESVASAQNAYNTLREKVISDFFGTKSEYIGCKECGSRLSKAYLKRPSCPLCGNSLLSETASNRLEKAKAKIAEYEKRRSEAVKKDAAKAKKDVRWLVKIEYHT